MSTPIVQRFSDADLSEMMATANKARSEELSKMFRQVRAYIAGINTSHDAAASQS